MTVQGGDPAGPAVYKIYCILLMPDGLTIPVPYLASFMLLSNCAIWLLVLQLRSLRRQLHKIVRICTLKYVPFKSTRISAGDFFYSTRATLRYVPLRF